MLLQGKFLSLIQPDGGVGAGPQAIWYPLIPEEAAWSAASVSDKKYGSSLNLLGLYFHAARLRRTISMTYS